MRDATFTRAGRELRRRVLDPLGHETFRRMVRETYRADHGYDVASAEARAGRRGLLDGGPYARSRASDHASGMAADVEPRR